MAATGPVSRKTFLIPPFYNVFLCADAAAFIVIFFKGVKAALLISDGVYSAPYGILQAVMWLIALSALSALNARLHTDWPARRKRAVVAVEALFFALAMIGAHAFAAMKPVKGIDTLWIANLWEMLPSNWWLMARISPLWALGEAVAAAVAIRVISLRSRWLASALTLGAVIFVFRQISDFPSGDKILTYYVMFGGPFVMALIAALAIKERAYSRMLAGGCMGLLIFWSYSGFIPKAPPSGFGELPGVTKIYPRPGKAPDFTLTFMRDFLLDIPDNAIYTTYGTACGVARIDLTTGKADVVDEKGLIRFIQTEPGENYIYGTNWDLTEMATITKHPFRLAGSQNLFGDGVVAVWEHVLDGKNQFVGTTEIAGLAKYTREKPGAPLERKGFLNFHALGLMKFKSGTQGVCLHPKKRLLYIQIGMLDTSDRYAVVAVNPDTMKIVRKGIIPEGGLELTFVPEHNSLISAAFFSNRLFELDADTLEIRRSFTGPLNSRNVVYDAKRDALYALSFLEGRLYVIRYSDMETLFYVAVGNRPNSLALWPERDTLFIGSSEGVFQVDLKQYLAPVEERFNAKRTSRK